MNTNVLGGVAAVVALGAILYFGHTIRRDVTAVARPQATVIAPAPKAPAVLAPKVEPKPEKKPDAVPATVGFVFHRVERGGHKGPQVECTSVKPFAEGKSPAELANLAKQYEVPIDTLKGYFVCTK